MPWDDSVFREWLEDDQKRIAPDIRWNLRCKRDRSCEFVVPMTASNRRRLKVKGFHNPASQKTTFSVTAGEGRIYSICMGPREHREHGVKVIGTHKHRNEQAYTPDDITATWDQVEKAWREFCHEGKIIHDGKFFPPPQTNADLYQ